MYEVFVDYMKAQFQHQREDNVLSIGAMNRLFSACGVACDINAVNLDTLAAEQSTRLATRSTSAAAADSGDGSNDSPTAQPVKFSNPLLAAVEHIEQWCDNGALIGSTLIASTDFEHKIICAEVLFAFIESLRELGDVETVGAEFATAISAAMDRLQAQLAAFQLSKPNTMKAVHTLLANRVVSAEYQRRVHGYASQGFFSDKYAEEVCIALERRLREVERYCHVDVLWQLVALISCNFCLHDHPVIACFVKDKKGAELATEDAMRISHHSGGVQTSPGSDGRGTEEFHNPVLYGEE